MATFSFHQLLIWGHLIQFNLHWTVEMNQTYSEAGIQRRARWSLHTRSLSSPYREIYQHNFNSFSHSTHIYCFMHSFSEDLLSTYFGPSPVLVWVSPEGLLEIRTRGLLSRWQFQETLEGEVEKAMPQIKGVLWSEWSPWNPGLNLAGGPIRNGLVHTPWLLHPRGEEASNL